jgi:hypothetical protein
LSVFPSVVVALEYPELYEEEYEVAVVGAPGHVSRQIDPIDE